MIVILGYQCCFVRARCGGDSLAMCGRFGLATCGRFGRRGGRGGSLVIYWKGGVGGEMKGRWNWNGKCINSHDKC
jgi:hypothetical protein